MEPQSNTCFTKREYQIAGLAFCGLAKKEMADKLNIAYGTVNIHTDRAFKKTGTSKLNELGAKWANMVFGLDIDFEALKRTIAALSLIGIMSMQISIDGNYEMRRVRNLRNVRRETKIITKITI